MRTQAATQDDLAFGLRPSAPDVKDVKVIDPLTVEFAFKEAFFTNILIALGDPILPKRYYSRFEPSQINQGTGITMGSGPFRLAKLPSGPEDLTNQWTPGEDVVLVRNEQYWAAPAPLAGMRFRTSRCSLTFTDQLIWMQ